ncbi:fimbria/pilus outer membrane usher protein [Aquitalea sp. ASV15]|uniref:fimbria/pilus outer membrane usher protein n=1 Tax=Aquitalea sp. ASV15 TaxID=2795104 RepID=UPI0018EC4550
MKSISFKKKPIHLFLAVCFGISHQAVQANENGSEPSFDRSLLWGDSLKKLDFSKFQTGSSLPEGEYSTDVLINEIPRGRRDLRLIKTEDNKNTVPCIPRSLLLELGVRADRLPEPTQKGEDICVDLAKQINGAFYQFDSNLLQLKISVPQVDMQQHFIGYTSPDSWDEGVPALLLDYSSNIYYSKTANTDNSNAYLSANIGLNLGSWRFRNTTSLNWSNSNGHSIQPIRNYISRDLDAIHSQLIIGDSFSDSDLFTSVPVRGIRIASDDRMKPINDTGYAPVVRGMANSNAHVVIQQNGYTIYDTTVAPGAFEIRDIAPASYNGDLVVTVTEADGKKSTFTVPFSAVPRSLREGSSHYNFTLGQVRKLANTTPMLGQFTYQRGMSNLLTLNGGVTVADGYTTLELGSVFNTGAGALGFDVSSSNTKINGTTLTGQSYRFSFNKLFNNTGTNVTLAAYRYSTSGYMDVQTALNIRDTMADPNNGQLLFNNFSRLRSRGEININQNFKNGSSAYISGSIQDYWGGQARSTQYQMGIRQGYKWGSLAIDANRQTNNGGQSVNSVMLSINFNLDSGKIFSSSLRNDSTGSSDAQLNMSGSFDQDRKMSYGINIGESRGGGSNSSSIAGNLAYQGSKGIVNASASSSGGNKQASLGLNGSVVAAAGTVLFGQPLGESTAIIEAPDAKGAMVAPGIGVEVDGSGHALLPSLSSYRKNDIQLETGSMSDGVQLDYSSTQAIPRSGSVVLVKFKTTMGLPLLLKTRFADESPLPFGASVKDKDGHIVGDIGQAGKLFARVKQPSGSLFVDLDGGKKCMLSYDNAELTITSFKTAVCQMGIQ